MSRIRGRITTLLIWTLIFSFATPANAFFSSSTSFTVPISELISISGRSTSTSFGLQSAGGQQATGISTSTSFNVWAGILYSLFGSAAAAATSSFSGTVYSNDGITTTTSTVSISINGGTKTTTSTDSGGAYIFTAITQPSAGDVVTVWMDNAGAGNGSGAVVTRYNSGNISGLDIYKNQLITRHEDSGPLINTDIDACTKTLGAGCADSDLHFDVSGGALTIDNDWGLYLWGGDTFTPGGSVTLANGAASSTSGGDLKWASSTSVLVMNTSALSIGGDFKNAAGGTFTTTAGQTSTFTATTTGFTINTGGALLRAVVFNGTSGEWSATSSVMTVGSSTFAGSLTMTAGTLNNAFGTSTINVYNGDVAGTNGTINLTDATFTMQLAMATSANFGATNAAWTFDRLSFEVATNTSSTYTFVTQTSGTGNVTVGEKLNVRAGGAAGANAVLNAGNRTWTLSGTDGTPFTLTNNAAIADLNSASSTFTYSGNNTGGDTTITGETYWTLTTNNASETFDLGGTTVGNSSVSITTGTLDLNGNTLTAGSFIISGAGTLQGATNVTVTGAISLSGTAAVNLTAGTFEHRPTASTTISIAQPVTASTTFYNLKQNNAGASSIITNYTLISGFNVANDWTIGDNSSSTYTFRRSAGSTVVIDVNNDVTIGTLGVLEASTNTIRIARNLTALGTLTPASSTFQFDTTTTSTITGTSTELAFYNLTAQTASKPIVFATSTPSYLINGLLTLRGTASTTPLYVESNSSGTQWNINHQGTEDVEFISLKDSGCVSTSTNITITNATSTSVDRGNNDNPCWLINDVAAGITVSGTVYSDEGTTTTTSSVKLAVGSSTAYTTSTNASGVYTFTNVTTPASGTVLTVWMNNNGGGNGDGAVITRATSTGDITGLDIYRDYLLTRHEDAGPLTNTDISVCDKTTGSACTDADLHFEVTTSTSALVVDNDWGLYLWGGDTFTPGGAVTLANGAAAGVPGGDIRWASSTSVINVAANALSVGGDWRNNAAGTFTTGGSTVTFTATSTGYVINTGGQSFEAITFNGVGGTWSATTSLMTVGGNLTMTNGTLDNTAGNADIVVTGSVVGGAGSINLTTNRFTQRPFTSTKTFGTTTSTWRFYNLDFTNSSSSAMTISMQGIASSSVLVMGDLTIGSSTDSAATNLNAASTSIILSGIFSNSSTTLDASSNSNNGTLTNMDPVNDYVGGPIGAALNFDGVNDYVRVTHHASLAPTDISIAAWVYARNTGEQSIVDKRGSDGVAGYQLRLDGGGFPLHINFISKDNSGGIGAEEKLVASSQVPQNQWVHIVGTYNDAADSQFIYMNGVLVASGSSTKKIDVTPYTGDLIIADNYNIDPTYDLADGDLDDIRIYNRTLNATEVDSLYNKRDVSANLIAHFPFSDGEYNDGIPFQFGNGSSDFVAASSTVSFTGNNTGGNTTIQAETYWNLDTERENETFTLSGDLATAKDLSVRVGTLNISNRLLDVNGSLAIGGTATFNASTTFNIAKDLTSNGTFSIGSSTAIFDSTATSTIFSSSTLSFWNFQSQTGTKPLMFGANQTFIVGGQLLIQGTQGNLISIDSTASGTQWEINHQGTEDIQYVTVKDSGCVSTSTYISVSYANSVDRGNNDFCWAFPSLSFTISPLSVNLSLGDTNTFTSSATNTLTVSTNGEFGYTVSAYEMSLLTHAATSTTIINWTGTNASPTVWTTTCISSATCGFGYSTNDADLTQFTSTKYAGFTTSTPGDTVAQSAARVTNDATVMTYRASVDLSQAAGDYQTTIRYIVAPRF